MENNAVDDLYDHVYNTFINAKEAIARRGDKNRSFKIGVQYQTDYELRNILKSISKLIVDEAREKKYEINNLEIVFSENLTGRCYYGYFDSL